MLAIFVGAVSHRNKLLNRSDRIVKRLADKTMTFYSIVYFARLAADATDSSADGLADADAIDSPKKLPSVKSKSH